MSFGFCPAGFSETGQMPGHGMNSFAFFNNGAAEVNLPRLSCPPKLTHELFAGAFCRNGDKKTFLGTPAWKIGDVIGVGVAFDSYNQWHLFTTRNGELQRHWTNLHHVPKGMDLFPVVGFIGVNLEVSINFGTGKVPLRASAVLPTLRKVLDTESHIDKIPSEVVKLIVAQAAAEDKDVASLTLPFVSKAWNEFSSVNEVWNKHYMYYWPNQNPDLKVKNWKKFFIRRFVYLPARVRL